jgi:hypothetical protein
VGSNYSDAQSKTMQRLFKTIEVLPIIFSPATADWKSEINSIQSAEYAGWGGRIRTSEWRNQNPTIPPAISTDISKKKQRNTTSIQ